MPFASIGRIHTPKSECLESRFLLSAVISVSLGYQDATQAIQNALNSAGGGGTVNLAPGNYNVSSQLTIPSGVTLEGGGKATLNWTGGGMGYLLYSPWNCVGTKVDGVTFDGASYKIDPGGSNLIVSNNTFENISFSDAYYGNGLYIPDVESNSSITGNTFTNITGNVGIYIFNAINVQIANNTFTNDSEAIKGQWGNSGSNDSISNNTLSGIYRFGIECQGDPVNLTVSGNKLSNWQQRDSHIALSIATGEGNGINITNNVILGTGISNPSTAYTAIEAMGNNLTIANNFASGWGWAELVGYTNHWVTENNTWGVNTAVWVIEAGGTNPSVDSGNNLVSLDAQPSGNFTDYVATPAPSTPPPVAAPSPTVNTSTSATTTTTAHTSITTTTTSTPAPAAPSQAKTVTTVIFGPAAPALPASTPVAAASAPQAVYANALYSVWGDGLDGSNAGDNSSFAYQTASSGTLTLSVRAGAPKGAKGNANVSVAVRSSVTPGAVGLSFKATKTEITKRLRTRAGFLYLRLLRTDGGIQGSYSTTGTDFAPFASVEPNP